MHIDNRLQAVAALVPQGARLADIGTDHAYLPVWLWEQGRIAQAVAGDIAAGPCRAARTTIAMYGASKAIEVRQGSGLAVLKPGEVDCIAICGMGGSTIISILEADMETARTAQCLILQPMAGAAGLRRWLVQQGWSIVAEDLVDDEPHFYEIICAERSNTGKDIVSVLDGAGSEAALARTGTETVDSELTIAGELDSARVESAGYSDVEYLLGPTLVRAGHPLLAKQIARQAASLEELLTNMARSERAKASAKYQEAARLLAELQRLRAER